MSIKSQTPGIASDVPLNSKQRAPIYKGNKMPLNEGPKAKSKEGFSENVKTEMNAGKPQKQAVAIAYSKAGEKKKSPGMRHGEHR